MRHCIYSSVLIKYYLSVQSHTVSGLDLELHLYDKYILSLAAMLGSRNIMHETLGPPSLHESFKNSFDKYVVEVDQH